jgi:hypothetical protein
MSGDTANAALWQTADVYIAPLLTAAPTDVTTAWAAAWDPVGLLDGDEGFTETRDQESNEFYAWGGILVKKTKSKHKRTIKFVALEDNDTVFALINPGSTRNTVTGLTTATVKVPTNAEFMIGFEVNDGTKRKRRIVERATVEEIGEVKESESGLTAYEVTVVLYPEADGTIYTDISGLSA